MKRYLLVIIPFLFFSCNNQNETSVKSFIVTSIEDGVRVSAKSDFKDTLFYEHRHPDTTLYSFVLLTKKQNGELKWLIENVCVEKDSQEFELPSRELLFIVDNGKVRFYKSDYSKNSKNDNKLLFFFRETGYAFVRTKEKKDFWNIGKVLSPSNSPKGN